jgi:pimeloyl-ACP methyl ester carboxylesterase
MSGRSATNLVPPAHLAREAGARECRVNVDGVGIRYLQTGAGPPLLLLHGLLGYSFSWRKNIAALAKVATVYAPDFPGAGYSDRVSSDCSFAGIARRMLKFMDSVGIDRATVVGTSHGGAVTMMMAALDRDAAGHRIERMVLVDAVNPYSRAGHKRIAVFSSPVGAWLALHSVPILKAARQLVLERMYGDPRRISAGTAEGYAAPYQIPGTLAGVIGIVKCWKSDLRTLADVLPKIADIPTLFIWGTRDTAVPTYSIDPLRRHFHNARLVLLDGVGHMPYEEVPEEFNRVLLEFLKK